MTVRCLRRHTFYEWSCVRCHKLETVEADETNAAVTRLEPPKNWTRQEFDLRTLGKSSTRLNDQAEVVEARGITWNESLCGPCSTSLREWFLLRGKPK